MEVSTDSTVQTSNMYNYLDPSYYSHYGGGFGSGSGLESGINISAFVIIAIVIIAFIAIFASLGNSSGGEGQGQWQQTSEGYTQGTTTIGIGLIILFIIVIFFSGLNYFYGSTVSSSLSNLFSSTPTIDVSVNQMTPTPSTPLPISTVGSPQVFNIPGNYYGYEDAKSLCSAYGSRLANYDELENAYNNGADWCSYGWSKGQMALFPTQKDTFKKLQKIKGHEHDCGRPGINGGYMANPDMQFGVNCFGVKPHMTEEEEQLMAVSTLYPKTEKDNQFNKKVDYWKTKLHEILVAPFNQTTWSRF